MVLDRGHDDGGVGFWDRKIGFRSKVCHHIRRKTFNSGEAHVKNLDDEEGISLDHTITSKKRKLSEESEKQHEFDSVEKKEESSCAICGRNFPSMKSLFGHMRCHPDRVWRGINPPKIDDRIESAAVDLTESLRRWPVTAKRGRKAVRASEDDRLRDAVNFLLTLARGESGDGGATEMKGCCGESEIDRRKMKLLVKNKKRRKKVKLCDLNLIDKGGDRLGGHGSTHNKLDIVVHGEKKQKLLDFDLNELPSSW